jgi:hypothetical protein
MNQMCIASGFPLPLYSLFATEKEYNKSFCFSFIRKGFFEYRTFRRKDEIHVGRILITKPGFEHTTRHIDNQPDLTTVFEFKPWFLERLKEEYSSSANWFLKNNDMHAMMLSCSVEAEYLYNYIMQMINSSGSTGCVLMKSNAVAGYDFTDRVISRMFLFCPTG